MKPMIYFQALNEIANFGDWSGSYETAGNTIDQSEDASYLYRGKYGLRVSCGVDDGYAYVYKDGLGISVAPGESVFLSFIQNFASNPSGLVYTTLWKNNNGDTVFVSLVRDDGKGQFTVVDDAGNWNTKIGNAVLTGKSHWITLELRRATSSTASDGYGKLYIDGVEDVIRDGQDNYDKFTSLN